MPGGRELFRDTEPAGLGPRLVTAIAYTRFSPSQSGSGRSDTFNTRFAAGMTVTILVTALLSGSISPTEPTTLTVLVKLPVTNVRAVTVTTAVSPGARPDTSQWTLPAVKEQLPRVALAEANVTMEGRGSTS